MGDRTHFTSHFISRWTAVALLSVTLLFGSVHPTDAQTEGPRLPSGPRPTRTFPHHGYQLEGTASWYGGKFQGRLTASGEVFDTNELTAAHRELPFDTRVRVTNTDNGKSVVVRINDRGPFVDNRVIDLSRAAAAAIGIAATGIGPVILEVVDYRPAPTDRTVQVASYGNRRNAETVMSRLNNAGLSAEIEAVPAAGVYRIIVPEVDIDEVEEVRNRLAELGYSDILVRQD